MLWQRMLLAARLIVHDPHLLTVPACQLAAGLNHVMTTDVAILARESKVTLKPSSGGVGEDGKVGLGREGLYTQNA